MRNLAKIGMLATGAIATGVTAYLVKDKVLGAMNVAGQPGCSADNPLPMPSSSAAAKQVPIVAERLRRAWSDLVGGEMPPGALEIALAQAMLESGINTWWTDRSPGSAWANGPKGKAFAAKFPNSPQGDMRGSNNLGARQCGKYDSGGAEHTCVPYGDSQPDAQGNQHPIQASFRYYKTPEAGARDFMHSIVKQWPAVAELKAGDVLGYVIRQGPKYRADDKPNQTIFGREYKGGNGYYGGFGATMEERVGGYGRAIISHLPMIAAALGHKKIHACIAPELLAATKGKHLPTAGVEEDDAEEPCGVALEGATVTVIAAFASAIAAAVIGVVATEAIRAKTEEKASEVIAAIRKAGFDYIDPGSSPRAGWASIDSNDPRILRSLAFLGDKRDAFLRQLASKGFGFQTKIRFPKPRTPITAAPAVASHELAHVRLPTTSQVPSLMLPSIDDDRGSLAAIRAAQSEEVAFAPATAEEAARRTFQGEEDIRFAANGPFDPGDGRDARSTCYYCDAPYAVDRTYLRCANCGKQWYGPKAGEAPEVSGEADVTAESAAASDAYATQALGGVGATIAVAAGIVAAGLAAGAGVATLASKVAEGTPSEPTDTAPPTPAFAPSAAPTVTRPKTASTTQKTPQASSPARSKADAVATAEAAQRTAEDALAAGYGRMAPAAEIDSLLAAVEAAKARVTSARYGTQLISGADALQTLYLAGVLPRARALPGSDGTRFVWYIEPAPPGPTPPTAPIEGIGPTASAVIAFASGAIVGSGITLMSKHAQRKDDAVEIAPEPPIPSSRTYIVKPGDSPYKIAVAHGASSRGDWWKELADANPHKETRLVPRGWKHLLPDETISIPAEWGVASDLAVEGINDPSFAPALGAKEAPSDAAKATSTAFDVSDIVKSVTSIVDAGDKIARRYKKDDPLCRAAVREFVERHPLITRWFAPELKSLAGVPALGAGDIGMFADRYVSELSRQREALGDALADCAVSPDEDRAVLGALMAPLGLSKEEENAIYTVASRTAATALDLYAPGSGGRATEASDALSSLITGRQLTPKRASSPADSPKPKQDAALRSCRTSLNEEAAKVSAAKEWASRHPWLAALTSPDLRRI